MIISDFIEDLARCRTRTIKVLGVELPWPFPIAYGLRSSSAMVFGRPIYGGQAGPVLKAFHGLFTRIHEAKLWVLYRFHPRHRYHMINTGLGYGYHERDDQLLYGAMACLAGYVDDCERSGCHDPGDEARAILHWWKVQRPVDQAQHDKWLHEIYGDRKYKPSVEPVEGQPHLQRMVFPDLEADDAAKQKMMWALDEKIKKDEQDFLHRLVDIRQSMWT